LHKSFAQELILRLLDVRQTQAAAKGNMSVTVRVSGNYLTIGACR